MNCGFAIEAVLLMVSLCVCGWAPSFLTELQLRRLRLCGFLPRRDANEDVETCRTDRQLTEGDEGCCLLGALAYENRARLTRKMQRS